MGHVRSYDIRNNFESEFSQSSLRIDYDITKRFSVSAGAIIGGFSLIDDANRLTFRTTYQIPVLKKFEWSNSIQGELHSSKETNYKYRILYITRLTTKKRFGFLRLKPSISYWLFYNIGGRPIKYYDENENFVVQQTPDGFHRGRLSLNLNSKVTNNLNITLYTMMQREFNLFSNDYRKINVLNPIRGRIIRPFNNYNVIGITATLNFDLHK